MGNVIDFRRHRGGTQPKAVHRHHENPAWLPRVAIAAAVAGLGAAAMFVGPVQLAGRFGLAAGCNIKGNIAIGGERIYHVPGQSYYSDTRVSPMRGERWFCSEADARAAGWRRSRI
ncbi:hypothetical protein SAMN02982922_2332 [Mesorhizobium australicum]|uniref:Succinoglycan biosynthesis protein ExoI n=2 Tax=Mesorhizobium australicum TaxID=536018 RepID=A0A1X7NQQ4_9HYPH|nr:succinoglycan biosynthesis protein exoi [Mesorhizobium australicum]SMH40474.1 hypothetical protein SAMN02982922_2332 [Mesorhizobium australicum]